MTSLAMTLLLAADEIAKAMRRILGAMRTELGAA